MLERSTICLSASPLKRLMAGEGFETLGPPRINDALKTALFASEALTATAESTRFAKEIALQIPTGVSHLAHTDDVCCLVWREQGSRCGRFQHRRP